MVLAKRLLLVSGGVVSAIALGLLFVWYQLTQMPTSLQSKRSHSPQSSQAAVKPTPQTAEEIQKEKERVFTKISKTLGKFPNSRGEVRLNQDEMDILVRSQFVGDTVKDASTSIENGKMKISTVVDTQAIANDLGEGNPAKLAQALSKIPGIKDNSLYIEVEGKPIISDNSKNKIALENNTSFKLGNFPVSISQLSQYTGISEVYLKDKITSKGILVPIQIENVRVEGESIIIRGSATAW
ncbi:hypothetical protein [Brunnivagina elsteri]|uniref:Uncharacterized protein n=1 Tax=Brunnivagina elsteri CCALA 953 TaxID=987040 RepID=A0A2A2TK11_9CYAN|nr:hypothetical protein [Calothrix elsteri]PAX56146.1 hypothetical protein CK510_10420 [Calothrix elsteri CCALA 953]